MIDPVQRVTIVVFDLSTLHTAAVSSKTRVDVVATAAVQIVRNLIVANLAVF